MGSPSRKGYWGLETTQNQITRSGDRGCPELVGVNGARLIGPRCNRVYVEAKDWREWYATRTNTVGIEQLTNDLVWSSA
ncbi:BgTH12-02240 [Blumeria graminis f. sp. triticale]|uniref:BgTH12-02240 n=1 Tax=Blumeria graminis f. sp. triticale TaxID=1689686 RepID=A0A9W4GDX9_BLUGR|nr:BgTH12-02240 [Blumeria graminis f. sp. triticale]